MVDSKLKEGVCDYLFEYRATRENPLTEKAIAEHFGVSRTPIREVLIEIETQGLVSRAQGKGVYLNPPRLAQLRDLYDLRAVLEAYAGPMAVRHASTADIAWLAKTAAAIDEARSAQDLASSDQLDAQFHRRILDLSGNELLLQTMDSLSLIGRTFKISHEIGFPDLVVANPASHQAIVDAFRRGSAEQCGRLLNLHVIHARDNLIDWYKEHVGESDA